MCFCVYSLRKFTQKTFSNEIRENPLKNQSQTLTNKIYFNITLQFAIHSKTTDKRTPRTEERRFSLLYKFLLLLLLFIKIETDRRDYYYRT